MPTHGEARPSGFKPPITIFYDGAQTGVGTATESLPGRRRAKITIRTVLRYYRYRSYVHHIIPGGTTYSTTSYACATHVYRTSYRLLLYLALFRSSSSTREHLICHTRYHSIEDIPDVSISLYHNTVKGPKGTFIRT